MAWLFIGIFLLIEGLAKLNATLPYKEVFQGICLCVAGILFIIGA